MRRPEPATVLDRRTLNRSLLARQGLLARGGSSIAHVIDGLVGMQAQVPRDPYIGLWARLRDFDAASLETLLLERRVVRMTLMRTTLHLVTARDATVLRSATQSVCELGFRSSPFRRRLDGVDLDTLCEAGIALVEDRPLTVSELGAALAERWPERDREAMAYAVRYLVPLVQVPPRGLLRRSSVPRVTTLRSWLDGRDDRQPALGRQPEVTERAPDEAVERYLRAFGPATAADVRAWSWLPAAREIIERLRPRLRSYRDEAGRELVDVADGLFAAPDSPAPVRVLGEYDNVFLAHADRTRITGELTWGGGWSRRGAFFVDGYLAGAWRPDRSDPARIELEARRPLTADERRDVTAEALALARFLADGRGRPEAVWVE